MKRTYRNVSRRHVVARGGLLIGGAAVLGSSARLLAESLKVLDVASAGSIGPMLNGPLEEAVSQKLQLNLHLHAQGADAVAKSLVDGTLMADVFIPITEGPMRTVMRAGKAMSARPIARTEMVIVYSPKSRFASRFQAAAAGKENWWEILQEPKLRLARSNPAGDPGGRNVIFTMMLAAKKYQRVDLVQKVLGPTFNPDQILTGSNQERLHSGVIDASASYKVGPGFENLPYLVLPKDINLSGQNVHAEHPEISLTLGDKTFYPEPLVFYAATLKDAANSSGATAFVNWLMGSEAQSLLRQHQYDEANDAPVLHT
jgi:molybdate/tungstate transport system substrate-binding protein